MLPEVRLLPPRPGIYRFRDVRGRVLYIGRATDLRSRVASYWSSLGNRPHLARMVTAVARVEALVCDSVHEAAWLERNTLERSLPRWNRTPGGQEVPVHLLLDDTPSRPGLRVTHLPVPGRLFGPYLGGLRARLAVSGLHRISPLPYAARALTGAEQDMAERLGVSAQDRERLAGELAAVLEREPGAVARATSLLAELRDRASGKQAYERAAKIQAELDALAWITAPQRVTVTGGADLTFDAWAGDTSVRFTVRGGRLVDWGLRRTKKRTAEGPPAAWADFAERNAALAAVLATG
jgi:excinuclease UvrABC nuclease subunit